MDENKKNDYAKRMQKGFNQSGSKFFSDMKDSLKTNAYKALQGLGDVVHNRGQAQELTDDEYRMLKARQYSRD